MNKMCVLGCTHDSADDRRTIGKYYMRHTCMQTQQVFVLLSGECCCLWLARYDQCRRVSSGRQSCSHGCLAHESHRRLGETSRDSQAPAHSRGVEPADTTAGVAFCVCSALFRGVKFDALFRGVTCDARPCFRGVQCDARPCSEELSVTHCHQPTRTRLEVLCKQRVAQPINNKPACCTDNLASKLARFMQWHFPHKGFHERGQQPATQRKPQQQPCKLNMTVVPSPAAVVVLECGQHRLAQQAPQEIRHQLQRGQASRQGQEVCEAQHDTFRHITSTIPYCLRHRRHRNAQ
jgi:hypothetical protein